MAISSFKQAGRISCFAFYKVKNGGFLTVLLVMAKNQNTHPGVCSSPVPLPATLTPLFAQLYNWPLKIMF